VGTNRLSGESQYNYVTAELGLAGLLLWVAFSTYIIVLAVSSIRRIADMEIRLILSAIFAAFIAFTLMGFGGSTMSALPFGPYFWFAVGIAAYWFGGGLQREQTVLPEAPT
jgi:O-antigen ligase